MADAGVGQAQGASRGFYCRYCGTQLPTQTAICAHCGAPTGIPPQGVSPKERVVALLLCFFLGVFGAHRFYVGKIGTAILMILTIGGLGIWSLVDFILIVVGSFTDKEGRPLLVWSY